MRLLVSVRSAAETDAALSGGADIIDAKEPSRGSLGPVSGEALREILERVPPHHEVSVALGDFADSQEVRAAITSLPLGHRRGAIYLKLGFAGVSSTRLIGALIQTARDAALSHPTPPGIIAVAYADARLAGTADPEAVRLVAAQGGAVGVLLDTHTKSSDTLLSWFTPETLRAYLRAAGRAGLLTAVAGRLGLEQLAVVASARPHVVGFRGAACEGGREGVVSRVRVRQLAEALQAESSGFPPGTVAAG